MMWNGDWSAGDWALMSVLMVLFWTAVVAGGVLVVRAAARAASRRADDRGPSGTGRPEGRTSAREVLDERYARGELSDEEYRARRDVLSSR